MVAVHVQQRRQSMKFIKRGAALVAAAAVSAVVFAAPAAATITPNPYSTRAGTGTFTTISSLGNGSCNLSGINASATGASGSVTAFTASGCRGTITAARKSSDITISSSLTTGVATAAVSLLVTNILGGTCLYAGTMTGRLTRTSTITLTGTIPLTLTLGGICTASADSSLSVTLPGATFG
ncbi:autotransporter [Conexibacter sp. CPCC 205706]|nr:autotransporter [Conexibacter sp. CPCC 205706]